MNNEKIEISYTVLPHFGKINAELYKVYDRSGIKTHIHLINKEFGSVWRKPIEQDYTNAKEWVDLQIKCMKANNVNIVFIDS